MRILKPNEYKIIIPATKTEYSATLALHIRQILFMRRMKDDLIYMIVETVQEHDMENKIPGVRDSVAPSGERIEYVNSRFQGLTFLQALSKSQILQGW